MFDYINIIVIISIILFLVIGGAALYCIINQFKAPVKSGKAKVISKRHFRNEMYHSLIGGEEGILSYKGCWLVSFEN